MLGRFCVVLCGTLFRDVGSRCDWGTRRERQEAVFVFVWLKEAAKKALLFYVVLFGIGGYWQGKTGVLEGIGEGFSLEKVGIIEETAMTPWVLNCPEYPIYNIK